jgi:hypothetical protein
VRREWKPGEVALIRVGTGEWEHGIRDALGGWVCQHGSNHSGDHDAAPLAVIDPNDRNAAWRLSQEYDSARKNIGGNAAAMEEALRTFADQAGRPEEPTGLGAVVEDADGTLWTRVTRGGECPWVWSLDGSNLEEGEASGCPWDRFHAVRILSPGVTP